MLVSCLHPWLKAASYAGVLPPSMGKVSLLPTASMQMQPQQDGDLLPQGQVQLQRGWGRTACIPGHQPGMQRRGERAAQCSPDPHQVLPPWGTASLVPWGCSVPEGHSTKGQHQGPLPISSAPRLTCDHQVGPITLHHFVGFKEGDQPAVVGARVILVKVQDLHLEGRSVVGEQVLLCLCLGVVPADLSDFLALAVVGLLVPIEAVLQARAALHGDVAEEGG